MTTFTSAPPHAPLPSSPAAGPGVREIRSPWIHDGRRVTSTTTVVQSLEQAMEPDRGGRLLEADLRRHRCPCGKRRPHADTPSWVPLGPCQASRTKWVPGSKNARGVPPRCQDSWVSQARSERGVYVTHTVHYSNPPQHR